MKSELKIFIRTVIIRRSGKRKDRNEEKINRLNEFYLIVITLICIISKACNASSKRV